MMEKEIMQTQELHNYLKTRVMPILQPLQVDIMIHRPKDINQFCLQWLHTYSNKQENALQMIEDQDEPDQIFKQKVRKKLNRSKGFRVGVSGESTAFQTGMKTKNKLIENLQKPQAIKIKLLINLKNSILFKNLSHQDVMSVIEAMKPMQFKAGSIVIKENDIGNQLFIVDEGVFRCQFNHHDQIKRYQSGEAFGELSLLYGTKRASTIVAQTDGRVYALGRIDFNRILRNNVIKKTELCERIINDMSIFSTMEKYEKSKLYENLKQIDVMPGKYIIREGQLGDCFYIVAQGKLVAQKQIGSQVKSVFYYKEGDYFGELALINNVPRQASIKTLTKVKLIYIQRGVFKRLLGPLQHILKREEIKYRKFKEETKKGSMLRRQSSIEQNS